VNRKKMNIQFRLQADVIVEAANERDAFAIISEHFDRCASLKGDPSTLKNPFADGKWKLDMIVTDVILAELRIAYQTAVNAGEENFTWREMPFHTKYAKYLLEYIDTSPERPGGNGEDQPH
jgi:hypothetical protein